MAKTVEPNTSRTNSTTPTHDEIAAHAYQIYLREGCVEGRDMEHWLQAEAELRQQTSVNATNATGHVEPVREQMATPPAPTASAAPKNQPAPAQTLPNSVVPPSTPNPQVNRNTTPRRNNSGKREAAAAK